MRGDFEMMNTLSSNALDSMVSISRFNKGEANKIFDDVKRAGFKIVLKNNTPACVLISPEKYRAMVEELEEARLYALVAERLENDTGVTYSFEEILAEDGLTSEDLEDTPMEYGVDFE
jgi:PHD/YefM family antitoxin component YafN of YafNO toxin-antitoxin module